ncbi:MAG: hypothetical protein MUF50_02705 [Planctomycetes bacterium]|nr:hypothetical protein [Planctomycetota bacterium]
MLKKRVSNKISFSTLALVAIIAIINLQFYPVLEVIAATPTSQVTITNVVPNTPSAAGESVASTTSNPTNAGDSITFNVLATDNNGDDWKVAVCRNNTVPTVSGGIPACDLPANQLCVASSFVASGAQSSCAYTTSSGDVEANNWYAFACDNIGCSATSSQGNLVDGTQSPFYVNHAPSFSAASVPAVNPSVNSTFTATASDPDTTGSSDTVTLYVCKTAVFVGGVCTGGEWCSSSAVASNPSCDLNGRAIQDASYSAYGYVVDSHGAVSSAGQTGINNPAVVNNVAPVVSNVTLNNGTDLTLVTPNGDTTGFEVTFAVTDQNGCQNSSSGNEINGATFDVWRSGVALGNSCTSNNNNCYRNLTSCVQDGGSCTSSSDTDSTWTCTFALKYHADPTDTGSQFATENWLATALATDDNAQNSSRVDSGAGVELNQFMAYNVQQGAINYGSLAPNATSATDQVTTIEAQGNTGLNQNLSGVDMSDGSSHTIPVGQQHYSLISDFTYGTGDAALTTSASLNNILCSKTTTSGANATKNAYWKIRIPLNQYAASYTGTNTIVGVVSSSANW